MRKQGEFQEELTKAETSKRIEELQAKTGRSERSWVGEKMMLGRGVQGMRHCRTSTLPCECGKRRRRQDVDESRRRGHDVLVSATRIRQLAYLAPEAAPHYSQSGHDGEGATMMAAHVETTGTTPLPEVTRLPTVPRTRGCTCFARDLELSSLEDHALFAGGSRGGPSKLHHADIPKDRLIALWLGINLGDVMLDAPISMATIRHVGSKSNALL